MTPLTRLRHFLLLLCLPGLLLPGAARSQDRAATAAGSTADPADELTDTARIIRLKTSLEAEQKRLVELTEEVKKAETEESAANASFQQLSTRLEEARKQLQKLLDAGKQDEADKQMALITDLEPKLQLAREQFDLAIQTRKTVQEQLANLQQKIATDQAALARLEGLPEAPATSAEVAPSEPAPQPESQQASSPEPEQTAADVAEKEKQPPPVSKALAEVQQAVQGKAQALQNVQQDLEELGASKSLLEKDIELESDKLIKARQKHDALERAREAAENEFNEKLAAGVPTDQLRQLRTEINDTQQKLRDARAEIRRSTDRIQELRERLYGLQKEELQLVKRSELLDREVAAAKRSEAVLKVRDYLYRTVPQILAILLLTGILLMLVRILCERSRNWIARAGRGSAAERKNRADTLVGVFRNTGNMVLIVGCLLMTLDAAGVPIAALLGGAGVVGLAVAFGAQSLMKDYFCGFIMLLEGQYQVNDVVTIGGLNGNVERITLRVTVLRDFEGKVHFIPNGQITSVTNATMDWARAVLEISVAYKENVDRVIEEIRDVAGQLQQDPSYRNAILDEVEMLGVENLADSSVIIKFGVKTAPDKKWPVRRELLRRIKERFDERGIEIPFPHQTVIYRGERNGAGAAEALPGEKGADAAASSRRPG